MKNLLFLSSALFLVSCGQTAYFNSVKVQKKDPVVEEADPKPTVEIPEKNYKVPIVIEPYVQLFIASAKELWDEDIEMPGLIIEFKEIKRFDDDGNEKIILGTCFYSEKIPLIHIDPRYWAGTKIQYRAAIILHELAHCIHKRGHRNTKDSLMYPYILSTDYFAENEIELLTELHDPQYRNDIFSLHKGSVSCGDEH